MTISTTTNRVIYTGNGSTVDFSFPYAFFAKADLVVIETIIATGVQTTKTLTTHYTIAGTVDALGHYSSGGTVTALTAPASTVTWTIYRDPTATQTTDLVENDPMPAESLEAALDYLTMLQHRTRDITSRCLQQPEGDNGSIGRLPSKVDRASQYLGFDSAGNPIAIASAAGITTVTAYMATLLDDANAAAALLTLGIIDPTAWTPSLGGDTTYATQEGTYIKIGKFVFVRGRLAVTLLGTGSATTISGLPFTATETTPGVVGYFTGIASSVTALSCYTSGTTLIMAGLTAAATGITQPLTTFQNSAQVHFSACYLSIT